MTEAIWGSPRNGHTRWKDFKNRCKPVCTSANKDNLSVEKELRCFARYATGMPRIHPNFLCHRLTMDDPKAKPIVHRERKMNEEK